MTSISEKLRKTYSGIFGNQVLLRSRRKNTVMTIEPVKNSKTYTENQEKVKERFRNGAAWAKEILKDPDLYELYLSRARDGKTPYTVALTDYLRPPKILLIDTANYTGAEGDEVIVSAVDDVKVMQVEVAITGPNGVQVENGVCTRSQFGNFWTYVATTGVETTAGLTITARATDIPGNKGESQVTL